jgi:hypothetical protein
MIPCTLHRRPSYCSHCRIVRRNSCKKVSNRCTRSRKSCRNLHRQKTRCNHSRMSCRTLHRCRDHCSRGRMISCTLHRWTSLYNHRIILFHTAHKKVSNRCTRSRTSCRTFHRRKTVCNHGRTSCRRFHTRNKRHTQDRRTGSTVDYPDNHDILTWHKHRSWKIGSTWKNHHISRSETGQSLPSRSLGNPFSAQPPTLAQVLYRDLYKSIETGETLSKTASRT